jgi:threonine dehydratase
LLGLQAKAAERPQIEAMLDSIHYRYSEETDNPAYQIYLS